MTLRGYRSGDLRLLTGPWPAGELLGLPPTASADRPALDVSTSVEPPKDHTAEICIVPDTAFVRFADIDWINRRARLEIGMQPDAADSVEQVLKTAVAHGFRVLNLHRVFGWVTPAFRLPTHVLEAAGFQLEATIPDRSWLAGQPVERQIWGAVRGVVDHG